MRDLLAPYGIDAISAGELGLAEPEETGATFRENARIKAEAAAKAARLPAFADDSGLVVDALDGAPGIHSARWAGPSKDFAAAMQTIEDDCAPAAPPRRSAARPISCPRCAWPGPTARPRTSRPGSTARWFGRRAAIAGFGYDPMFLPDGHDRTFGEMTSDEKHGLPPRGIGLSHRARAFLMLAGGLLMLTTVTLPDSRSIRPSRVYIHWPFCLSKCPYCDFNSHVRHGGDRPDAVRARLHGRDRRDGRARPGPDGVDDFLRRRHAVADAARDRCGDAGRRCQAIGASRRTSRSRWRPTPPASRPTAFAGYRTAGVEPRLARRAGARRCRAGRARSHAQRHARRWPRVAVARSHASAATRSI